MIEADIIKELKSGNSRVLKHVYQHLDLIVSYVKKNSGTTDDAHDLFQDAVIVFHRNVVKAEFELTSSISTYLFGICRRMWYNKLKAKNKMAIDTFEIENNEQIESFEYELPLSQDVELIDRIDKALEDLGEPCKSLLQMFYFKKLSQKQIKEELDYNSSQVVRQQKYRCLKRIREKLI